MDIYAEARKRIPRPLPAKASWFFWFLGMSLVGAVVPGMAEFVCGSTLIDEFGLVYQVDGNFLPAVSNVGPFIVYACVAPRIFWAKFESPYLARRLVLGGLWGMSLTMFWVTCEIMTASQGPGYLLVVFVYPMFIIGGIAALLGIAAGWLYDVARR